MQLGFIGNLTKHQGTKRGRTFIKKSLLMRQNRSGNLEQRFFPLLNAVQQFSGFREATFPKLHCFFIFALDDSLCISIIQTDF